MTDSDETFQLPAPRIDSPRARLVHSLCRQMHHVQWWPAAKLARNQLKELRSLLQFAQEQSPFYRERLATIDPASCTRESFQTLPLLTRDELRDNRRTIDCRRPPPAHGALESTMTSGSTGSPVTVRTTGLVGALWDAVSLRDHLWHRRDASLTNAALRWRTENIGLAPDGWLLKDWGVPHNQFFTTGPGYYLNTSCRIDEQADWLLWRNPHYLISHPSNLRGVLLELRGRGRRPENLRQVRTVGEALPEDLRALVREVAGVELVDCYSSQEVGYIALQCPEYEHYHVQADSLLVEILDSTGAPCEPGETGRVVVTSLRNYATPIIRYDIGDFAEVGAACPCGRGLPVLTRIQGRVRNLLRLPDGGSRWPNLGFREIMSVAPLRQFQVVQHALDRLEVRLVVPDRLAADSETRIRAILAHYLDFPYRIDFSYPQSLPRTPNGKYEDFVCLLDPSSSRQTPPARGEPSS